MVKCVLPFLWGLQPRPAFSPQIRGHICYLNHKEAIIATQSTSDQHPNILFVFADQMRVQATGYSGNRQVHTPNMDRLAAEGVQFTHAVAGVPVCTPYRACLLTGRYPLSTGMLVNDLQLPTTEVSIGHVLKGAGYDTGYIGKWHLDGPKRGGFTPPGPRRQGFDFWAVGNCTHNYFHSVYYRDEKKPLYWNGYDAEAQTTEAIQYLRTHDKARPFSLFLSWGPPHNPCLQVPQQYLSQYDPAALSLRPNCTDPPREEIAGYYAHVTALDEQLGRLMVALEEEGLSDNTILVFTSDHGDMLGSQGVHRKQWPWDECILVPFLLRYPGVTEPGRSLTFPFNVVDVMPSLLNLTGIEVPETVEGTDVSSVIRGRSQEAPESALIVSICPFGESKGPEWRGIRTERYTYVKTLEGPWLLYDNQEDPYQLTNLVYDSGKVTLLRELEVELQDWLEKTHDDFLPREAYWERFGLDVRENGTIPYTNDVE